MDRDDFVRAQVRLFFLILALCATLTVYVYGRATEAANKRWFSFYPLKTKNEFVQEGFKHMTNCYKRCETIEYLTEAEYVKAYWQAMKESAIK